MTRDEILEAAQEIYDKWPEEGPFSGQPSLGWFLEAPDWAEPLDHGNPPISCATDHLRNAWEWSGRNDIGEILDRWQALPGLDS